MLSLRTKARPGAFRVLPALAAVALGWTGCSTYEAKPIDRASVDKALEAAPLESIKVEAARIKHPLLAPVVIDGGGGFTPEEIAVMVVIVSPDLRALRDQRGVAEAQVLQAGILPNPQLGYSVDRPRGAYDPAVVAAKSLGLTWEVTSLLAHHDRVAAARAGAKSVDLSIAWQEWQAAQDARLRAYRILSLQRRLPLARSVEELLADTVELSRKAVSRGLRTTSDLTTATDAWTQAQNTRFDLEQQLSSERAALNLSLAMPPATVVALKAPPRAGFSGAATPADAAALSDGLEERRLDLIALRLGYESQESSLRAAVLAQFPRIGLGLNKTNDTTPIYTRGAAVTVDLPLFDRNQGQVAVGKATRQQLFDEYVARVAEARSQVSQALVGLSVVNAQLSTVASSLPDLRRLVAANEEAGRSRNADELAYRDAKAALAGRLMEQDLLEQQRAELEVALEIATGRPSLNTSPPTGTL